MRSVNRSFILKHKVTKQGDQKLKIDKGTMSCGESVTQTGPSVGNSVIVSALFERFFRFQLKGGQVMKRPQVKKPILISFFKNQTSIIGLLEASLFLTFVSYLIPLFENILNVAFIVSFFSFSSRYLALKPLVRILTKHLLTWSLLNHLLR